ncbi:unnamed protein product [Cuscuta epithymum]|uniref:DYW domain-containing protein n=1 Tax=Cuscuta epithymum TaxID=186058 RepID=A0AAV0EFZ3_9ASTE|nr:unnamed protein product [Cuscuta epithymum]
MVRRLYVRILKQANQNIQNQLQRHHFFQSRAIYHFQYARHPFDKTPKRDQDDKNPLLFEYSISNMNAEVLNLFTNIHRFGCLINQCSLSCVLKSCSCLSSQFLGKQAHCHCTKSGFLEDVSVGTSLMDMYMKTGSIIDGERVFDEMGGTNVVTWTTLIAGYSSNGLIDRSLQAFKTMQMEGIKPNSFTFATVFGAFAGDDTPEKGFQLHALVIKFGFDATLFVGNSLISLYSRSGMVEEAKAVFGKMEIRSEVSWNAMITGFVSNRHDFEALELFHWMRVSPVKQTRATYLAIIKLCSNLKESDLARQVHCWVMKSEFGSVENIRTALMGCYTKCGDMDDAFKLFSSTINRNVISWTAIIGGYLRNNCRAEEAANLFCQMRKENVKPNHFTYSTILSAYPVICISQLHSEIVKTNYENSPTVGTALLDAYVKTGCIHDASKVFETIHEKDIVAWSAMVAGYAQDGDTEKAVKVFSQLAKEGVLPNEFTFSSVINACATSASAVEQGKQFHGSSIKFGYNNALCVSCALVTMYAKRGSIESANVVFQRQKERDLVSWNSMITGYAHHGYAPKALQIFEEMRSKNMEMDVVTFIGVISACTHTGLVSEGEKYFDFMVKDLQIPPSMEIYSCMVDLYSRAGKMEKATSLIDRMPFPASATVWRTILAACRVQRNMELGKLAADKLISLHPQDSAAYVLLSNLYAASGNWQERDRVRKMMEERGVKKETGYSWIEIKNKTYTFTAGDGNHPLSNSIYMKLEELSFRLREAGYEPDTSYVLHDVEDEHKAAILSRHSERLAIAFGLIATSPGIPIQIVKNLRVCGDCHTVIKLISKIEGREIIVRDSNRFHHFKGALCSCGDYW